MTAPPCESSSSSWLDGLTWLRCRPTMTLPRGIDEQCLELASRHPQSKALAQAHRIMGHMDWAQGQFVEARAHLEQCFAISFSDEVAKDHSQAFVQDVIVPAWGYLSCLLWQLGYSQLAEAAGRQSVPKAREIGQPNRLAFALHSELLRRRLFEADPDNALPLADEIVACGKQPNSIRLGRGFIRVWWRRRTPTRGPA